MTSEPRFTLYIKAGKDGKSIGDCPFSQTAYMTSELKVPKSDIQILTINTYDKPQFFLNLYPEGKVPVLIDRQTNKMIPDSLVICQYLSETYPSDVKPNYDGPEDAVKGIADAAGRIFSRFATFITNEDDSMDAELRHELVAELAALDRCFQAVDSGLYQVSDHLYDVDCQLLPKLRHVQVAGKVYKNFEIPHELSALAQYIHWREQSEEFKTTCPPDDEIIYGWGQHKQTKGCRHLV